MFLSHSDSHGPSWGVAIGGRFVAGTDLLGGRHRGLRSVLEAGALREAAADAARHLQEGRGRAMPDTLLPTIPDPAHVFCAGLNYAAHAAETGRSSPTVPRIFLRAASSLVGHGAPLLRPAVSDCFDYEGELAVIIGSRAAHVPEERAMDHVAGYTLFMDGSIRDWQEISTTLGKNFVGTGALGPGLVPAWEVPDWRRLALTTRLNGRVVQTATMDRMIHGIPSLIAWLSRMTPLLPGDVIATGTPAGIGCRQTPPLWLRPGDRIEVESPGIGCLSNPIAQGGI